MPQDSKYRYKNAVVYAANDAYAFLAGISMMSLFDSNRELEDLCCYVLVDGITPENLEKLRSIADKYNRDVYFLDIEEQLSIVSRSGINGYENAVGGGYIVYSRLLIDKLLPENIQTILYLDCDIIVAESIKDLLEEPMGNYPIAMGYDIIRNEYKRVIGHSLTDSYFNAGVLLINRQKWNQCKCEERIFDSVHEKGRKGEKYPLADQDFLNVVLKGEIKPLAARYNFISSFFLYRYKGILKVFGVKEECWNKQDSFEKSRQNIAIYHFAGAAFGRPWFENSKHPAREMFDRYYYSSPWKDRPKEKCHWDLPRKAQYFLYRYTPHWFSVAVGTLMQKMFINMYYKSAMNKDS